MIPFTTRYFWLLGLLIPVFGGFAQEPERGKIDLRDINLKKRVLESGSSRLSSDKSGSEGLSFAIGDWNIRPYYMHTVTLGSDAGGNRDENREQARGRTRLRAGVGLARSLGAWRLGGALDIRGEIDAHRFSASSRSHHQSLRTGNGYLFATYGASRLSSDKERSESAVFLRSASADSGRFYARVGRWSRTLVPEGLLFRGDAPGAELGAAFAVGTHTLRLGLLGLQMDREERIPYRKNGPSFFGGAAVGLHGGDWSVVLLGGFYRAPGRAAEPDLRLPGVPGTTVVVPTGQAARSDLDVRYYGLRYEQRRGSYDWIGGIYMNIGRAIAVDQAGIRQALTRKHIRGTLLHASFRMALVGTQTGAEQGVGKCDLRSPASGSCITNRPMRARWELEAGVLATTRDRDETDTELRGFGALRPGPVIMGGMASILLSGLPPARESSPLRNTQPGRPFSDGASPREEPGGVRDNGDPARPDYGNRGLNMGSLRLGYAPMSELRLDGFLNYGDFLRGDAFELILALQWSWRDNLRIFGAAAGASYRPGEDEINPLTGFSAGRPRRFYSRYLVGVSLRF